MTSSLLYVSQSNLRLPAQAAEVDRIVATARARNALLNVTGALVFTQARFAQILEGPEASIAELMASIERDKRHRDVEVVLVETIAERRFPDWSMAYRGGSIFVDRHIKPLLQHGVSDSTRSDTATKLLDLMVEVTQREQQRAKSDA